MGDTAAHRCASAVGLPTVMIGGRGQKARPKALAFCTHFRGISMPALSLRGLPQDIYDGLKAMAARNHRSMQEQARLLIEREVRMHQPGAMERARSWQIGRAHV
mgnify:CR=1 FL=1